MILVEMNEDTHDADEVENDVVCKPAHSPVRVKLGLTCCLLIASGPC